MFFMFQLKYIYVFPDFRFVSQQLSKKILTKETMKAMKKYFHYFRQQHSTLTKFKVNLINSM